MYCIEYTRYTVNENSFIVVRRAVGDIVCPITGSLNTDRIIHGDNGGI
jgi:hypothetical protein